MEGTLFRFLPYSPVSDSLPQSITLLSTLTEKRIPRATSAAVRRMDPSPEFGAIEAGDRRRQAERRFSSC
jgi:hypothetical protein